jgi:DNA-binding MarR family transcriptional regulator
MPLTPPSAPTPDFNAPQSILDLLNLEMYEVIGISGSLVTRICESDYGITREEWQFMAMLADMGPLSPSEIALRTTVDRSQVSKTLAGLVKKHLVDRQRVAGDARRVQMHISLKGQALYQQIFPRVVQVHHALLQDFNPEERQRLARDLERIKHNAQAAEQSLGPESTAPRSLGGSRLRWPT